MKFLVKEGLHHIIVLDILSVKSWSVNYKSSVKRQFDCRYQYQKQTNYFSKWWWIYLKRGDKLQTTCSYIDDWNRVLNAVTLLRTQWKLSDNMTSDLSKTSSLSIRLTSCYTHLRDEAIFMTFLKNVSVPNETEYVWIYRFAFSITCRRPSNPWTRRITIATKKRILLTRISTSRAVSQRSYHDENFFRFSNSGRRRARHVVCRYRFRTEVFDDFRCHVCVLFVTSHTFVRVRRH